jgi:pantothenate kinase
LCISSRTPPSARLLVGISGIPASGKSSFAELLIENINTLLRSWSDSQDTIQGAGAVLVGLDGWHLTRAQLDIFPDPKLAHDRRGIHWTFDGPAYVSFVRTLRKDLTPTSSIITAPSFDHALKDPAPHAISIHPHHRIVLIEGLYTFLSIDPWNEAGLLLDERWFIRVDIEEAQRRLVKRHVVSGVAKNLEEAIWRSKENDMPSASLHAYLKYWSFS